MSVDKVFKHNRARKNVIIGGGLILICITVLSCVSSFMIYRGGFADFPYLVQQALSVFAVIVVEGAFIWLVYGYTRAFASSLERLICMIGIVFLVVVMLMNLVTHFMLVKAIPLEGFQEAWISWGAITVFIGVLIIVLAITLADPVTRLIRLDMRYLGLQQEKIIEAKTDSLESERILEAMSARAEWEANQLANKILGDGLTSLPDRDEDIEDRIAGERLPQSIPTLRAGIKRHLPQSSAYMNTSQSKSAFRVPDHLLKESSERPQIGSAGGYSLPQIAGIQWEPNKKGGVEAWQKVDKTVHPRGKKYLGYWSQGNLDSLEENSSPEEFQERLTAWVDQKRKDKKIS